MSSPRRTSEAEARPASRAVVRTCIGCRQREDAGDLLRVVATSTTPVSVVPDSRRSAPGRGAHLHPTTVCLESAVRRKAFARALRVPGPVDAGPVAAHVAHAGSDPDRGATDLYDPPGPGGTANPVDRRGHTDEKRSPRS